MLKIGTRSIASSSAISAAISAASSAALEKKEIDGKYKNNGKVSHL